MNNNKKKGFTLVELLVVIAILAILATVSVVGYTTFINRAHESNAKTLLAQVVDYAYSAETTKPDYTVNVTSDELATYLSEMGVTATGFTVAEDGKTITYTYDEAGNKVTAVVGQ